MNPIHNVHLHTWYISDLYIHAKCLMCVIFKKYMQYDLFKKYLYHEAMKCTTYPLKASHFCWHLHLSTFPHGSSRNSPLVLKPPWSLHTKKKGSFEKKNGDWAIFPDDASKGTYNHSIPGFRSFFCWYNFFRLSSCRGLGILVGEKVNVTYVGKEPGSSRVNRDEILRKPKSSEDFKSLKPKKTKPKDGCSVLKQKHSAPCSLKDLKAKKTENPKPEKA